MLTSLAKSLYERDIYGFISIDFIAFPDPFKNNDNPLFWANGITSYYSNFNTICSLTQAASGSFESLEDRNPDYNKRRVTTAIPFIFQKTLPTIHFRSFFHLARLDNMFYDISTRRGIIFLIADSLQAGAIGLVCIDYDLTRSYQKLMKSLDFLRKQNVEDSNERYNMIGMAQRSDLIEFRDVYGGVKIATKGLIALQKQMMSNLKLKLGR